MLEKSKLDSYFSIYSFSNVSGDTRERIVQSAITQAGDYTGVVVIGDTKTDIAAGKANKAFTVGVSTESISFEELKKESPDLVVMSLEEYMKSVEVLEKIDYDSRIV